MIPLPIADDELDRALEILGGTLDSWQDAVQMALEHVIRPEPYDPAVDGPVLRDGLVFVGPRHLDLVEFALHSMVNAAQELGLVTLATRLLPLRRALACVADGMPGDDVGNIAG